MKVKISRSQLAYFFCLLLVLVPPYVEQIKWIHSLTKYGSLAVFAVFLLLQIKRRLKVNSLWVLIALFYSDLLFMTLIHSGDVGQCIQIIVDCFTFILIIDYGINQNPYNFMKALRFFFILMAIINLVTIIAFPGGLYNTNLAERYWFLGHKNGMIKWLLPGVAYVFSYDLKFGSTISKLSYIYLAIVFVTTFFSGSVTSVIAMICFAVLYVICLRSKDKNRFFSIKYSLLVLLVFFIIVVFLQSQTVLLQWIGNISGKSITMSGRTFLWRNMLTPVLQNPVFGYGIQKSETMQAILRYTNSSCHNLVLDYLYEGGLICLGLFAWIIFKVDKELIKGESHLCKLLAAVILAFSIVWNVETFIGTNFTYVVGLLYFAFLTQRNACNAEINGVETIANK